MTFDFIIAIVLEGVLFDEFLRHLEEMINTAGFLRFRLNGRLGNETGIDSFLWSIINNLPN